MKSPKNEICIDCGKTAEPESLPKGNKLQCVECYQEEHYVKEEDYL